MNYNVTAVYFSPTGTSKKSAESIAKVMDESFDSMDLTIIGTVPKKTHFTENDLVIFSAPVYGGVIYKGARKAFSELKGENTPCIILAVYGNRHYDDALVDLSLFAEENGFIPVAGAALLAEHTYGKILVGRPNEDDFEENRQFALKVMEKLSEIKPAKFPGNNPPKEGGNGGGFKPTTLDNCVNCGLCAKKCPTQAIDYDDVKKLDSDKCIACFRCVKSCPVKAKVCNTEAYLAFVPVFEERLSAPRENEYFM